MYDVKGRFTVQYKLGKVRRVQKGPKGIPYCVTHDGRIIRYPDPAIKVNDTIQIDIASGKISNWIKFDTGNLAMVTGGRNLGRVGTITTEKDTTVPLTSFMSRMPSATLLLRDYRTCLLLAREISQMSPYQLVKVCVSPLLRRGIEGWTELDKIFEQNFALIFNVR